MKPVWGLINRHDRDAVNVVLLSDAPRADIGDVYQAHERDEFLDIARVLNQDAARLASERAIDILVDLNGYSALGRLPLMALKPAPIVVGWFNTFATTGMACYDWVIGDANVIPSSEEPLYVERIARVSGCYLTFEVTYPVPEVAPAPCERGGPFTFGSLASLYKINDEVVRTWSEILRRCPQTRLVLKSRALGASSNRGRVLERFKRHDVTPERIELDGPSDHFEFLRKYGAIDLALDPFPYNGGTTTSEALWQGVPVLSFDGDRWAARQGASIMRSAGLDEFVAASVEDYVERAVRIATTPDGRQRLAELRPEMRRRLRESPLCDCDAFAREMEGLYRSFWIDWLARSKA
jgi:predicted O-linked N-acetylglucosamine transferase (SPINDLY family)